MSHLSFLPETMLKVKEQEGIMVSHDYLFMVLFVICAWLLLHMGSGHHPLTH